MNLEKYEEFYNLINKLENLDTTTLLIVKKFVDEETKRRTEK